MKDLTISHNEEKGFYCEDISSEFMYHLMLDIIEKYNLNFDKSSGSEIGIYFSLKELNKDKFNIDLREEDGSEWVFG